MCVVSIGLAQSTKDSIRGVDFKKYLLARDNTGQKLKKEFPHQAPIKGLMVHYADLIGEGDEQAVVEATTSAMGNGGADIVEVFRLNNRQLISLVIDDSGYKQGDLYEGQNWTPRLEIENGKLVRWFVMYPKGAVKNPKAGLKRVITYRWSKERFTIASVKDVRDDGH
jgi:hypothetical protein